MPLPARASPASFGTEAPGTTCFTPHPKQMKHMKKLTTLAAAAVLCLGLGAQALGTARNDNRHKTECKCKECKCDTCNGTCKNCCGDCRTCDRKCGTCEDECRPCHSHNHDRDDSCRPCHSRHGSHHRGHHRGCCR